MALEARAPATRGAMRGRDLTQGSIMGNLWTLSWPMMLSNSLNMVGPTIDMIWVGKLGTTSIASVGVAGIAVMLVGPLMMGLFTGLRAMVARAIGAGDRDGAIHVAQQAIVVSVAMGVFLAAVGMFLAEPIMRLTGVSEEVVARGSAYLRIQFLGALTMSFGFMSQSAMQASGDAMNPLKISVVSRIVHVALAPFLIFGWWIFPRLEISGAALAQVGAQFLGSGLGLWILLSGRSRLHLSFKGFRIDPDLIRRLVRIGVPASIMGMERGVLQFIWIMFMAPFGTMAVAAHSLVQRVEMMIFMPAMGFGMAAGVLVGQNLGARQPERAEKSGWQSVAMVEATMVVLSVVIFVFAGNIVRIFNADPELVRFGSAFLRIAVAGYLFMGFFAVLQQSIAGVGDTIPPMIVGLATGWGLQLPLAYFLPRITSLGVYGVRWAMVSAVIVGAAVYILYFRSGRWKRRKV